VPHDLPTTRSLYDPRFEHDSCGMSFVVHVKGAASHRIVQTGLGALCSMEHRGATGAEAETGDGAGILLQVPDTFLRKVAAREGVAANGATGFELPARGAYGVGIAFLPSDPMLAKKAKLAIADILDDEELVALGWRAVPMEPGCLGASARNVMPSFAQLFVAARGFASLANTELVDVVDLDDADREWLRATLQRHRELTDSAVAARLLASTNPFANFRKVMPRDYARVLRVIADAKAAGLDDAATSQKIMESVNG
jgi:hypothetical protein